MQDTEETTIVSYLVSDEFVALWHDRPTSPLIEESFSMKVSVRGT